MNQTTPNAANDAIHTLPRIFRRGHFWWCSSATAFAAGPDPAAAFAAWRRALAG